jgi:hypothetical protein
MSMFGNIMSSIFGGAAAGSPAAAGPAATGRAANPAATGAAASSPMATGATAASSTSASPQPGAGAPASAQARSGAAASPPVRVPVQVPVQVDVAAVMDKLAEASPEDLDWRTSIVDMMKLLKLDSSLAARKQLASELAYTASTKDTAAMNVWLHKQVMIKLAENGGKVPSELKH